MKSSPLNTRRVLPKIPASTTELSNPPEIDLSSSQRQTRSILRKQTIGSSPTSSVTSSDVNHRKMRCRIVTPTSTSTDYDIPLGTLSQRLFGASEYFVQTMNELDQQNKNSRQ